MILFNFSAFHLIAFFSLRFFLFSFCFVFTSFFFNIVYLDRNHVCILQRWFCSSLQFLILSLVSIWYLYFQSLYYWVFWFFKVYFLKHLIFNLMLERAPNIVHFKLFDFESKLQTLIFFDPIYHNCLYLIALPKICICY